eukprot:4275413-Lingulodinium_polyedra.AAC.1
MFSAPNRHPWVATQCPPVRERARVKHGEQPSSHVLNVALASMSTTQVSSWGLSPRPRNFPSARR